MKHLVLSFFLTLTSTVSMAQLTPRQEAVLNETFSPPEVSAATAKEVTEEQAEIIEKSLPVGQINVRRYPSVQKGMETIDVVDPDKTVMLDSDSAEKLTHDVPTGTPLVVTSDLATAEQEAKKGAFIIFIEKVASYLSFGVGETQFTKQPTSIWYQNGLPCGFKLISRTYIAQASIPITSIGFFSKLQNKFARGIKFDLGWILLGEGLTSKAIATDSGYSNPMTNPVRLWTGTGRIQEGFIGITEELPYFGLYVSADIVGYKDYWKMSISPYCRSTVTDNSRSKHFSFSECPSTSIINVYSSAKLQVGERFVIGKHFGRFLVIEAAYQPSINDNSDLYPPIVHKGTFTLEFRVGFWGHKD